MVQHGPKRSSSSYAGLGAASDVNAGQQKIWKTENQDTNGFKTDDDLVVPAGHAGGGHSPGGQQGWRGLLLLSFSALGVIYGDIGTSPLYAYQAVFTQPPSPSEVLSAASLFFWTLTLIVLLKYVFIVLRFDDNGEGGTFALYSLICRAAGFTAFGPAQPEERQLAGRPGGVLGLLPPSLRQGHWWSLTNEAVGQRLRRFYSRSRGAQVSLLLVIVLATAMVVGDGVLTPSISVLSAISGLKVAAPSMKQGEIIGITIVVLVLLFSVQYMGTEKIAMVFSPIVAVWLLFNAAIGLTNLSTCGWGAWQAISPHHGIAAFTSPGGFEQGWRLLAGVMLAITGAEAMYADLGHFNAAAVRLSFCGLVYPCLIITYMGQASYLIKHPQAYTDPFWLSVPRPAFWPMLVVATAASVVASQALISGVFSIMRQAMNLGVFPPMKVTHTDSMTEGQIYIRQINFLLMLGCIAMVAGFQDTTALGHAYGVAVMSVMFVTTFLTGLVMLVCYGVNPLLVAAYLVFFVPLEGLFLSSNIIKIPEGGWVTIMIAVLVASINLIWWYGSGVKAHFYRSQAARNKGLLAQLPLKDLASDADTNGDGDFTSRNNHPRPPPQSPAPAASTEPVAARPGPGSSSITRRRQGSGVHAATTAAGETTLQQHASADLVASSAPVVATADASSELNSGASAAAATIGASGASGAGLGGGWQKVAAGRAGSSVRAGSLVSKSWSVTRWPDASGGGAGAGEDKGRLMFNKQPLSRLPGMGIIYTQATSGLPVVLQHLLINMPVLYDVTVLLTLRFVPQPYASRQERFLVRRSRNLAGVYRVIVRYGYMEQVDHGPSFVRQLVGCLINFVLHQHDQEQQQLVPGHDPKAPGKQQHVSTTALSPFAAVTRDAAEGDTVIEMQTHGAAAGQEAGSSAAAGLRERSLSRWSRVPMGVADGAMLDELASGPLTGAHSLAKVSRALLSPRTSLDTAQQQGPSAAAAAPGAAATMLSPAASLEAPAASVLGRESINRHQYRLQKASFRKLAPLSPTPAEVPAPADADAAPTAAAEPTDQPAPALLSESQSGAMNGDSSSSAADGGRATIAAAAETTKEQLKEIGLLIDCWRHRTVYIMGRSEFAAAARSSNGSSSGSSSGSRKQKGLRAMAAWGSAYAKGMVTGLYRVLANNTHPSSQSWQLPDDQLLLVAVVVRV